jgi:hypothetical protein
MPQTLVRPHPLDTPTVLQLQSARGYPCVSLLLPTTPGQRLGTADRAALEELAAQARRRVREESPPAGEAALTRLDAALTVVIDRPVHAALALFVNADSAEVVDLPVPVQPRCVVDPTFATRDLVRALHRTPRHVLLLLAADEARLMDGALGKLGPAASTRFPKRAVDSASPEAFLREVDRALGAYLRVHPAPVIVAATEPTLSTFRGMSTNLGRLAGTIPGNHLLTPLPDLAAHVRLLLEGYLLSREAEAMELLATRRGQKRAVLGIDASWRASRWERPEMLAVEEGFFYPAWVSDDGDELTPTDNHAEMGAIDDAVDELIEAVLTRGGWVALVQDGIIPDGAKVALTLRQ